MSHKITSATYPQIKRRMYSGAYHLDDLSTAIGSAVTFVNTKT